MTSEQQELIQDLIGSFLNLVDVMDDSSSLITELSVTEPVDDDSMTLIEEFSKKLDEILDRTKELQMILLLLEKKSNNEIS